MAAAKRVRVIKFEVPKIIKRSRLAMTKALKIVVPEITKAIRQPMRRKFYPPASKPGTAPARRTSNLFNNTRVERKGFKLFVRTQQYGIWLDEGTSRMAARPFIGRVIRQKRWTKRINQLTKKFSKPK